MSTITTINASDLISDSRAVINTNFSNLNTDKAEKTLTVNSKALSTNPVLTTADIADSADKRYVTDAQKTVIGNTSGTNTGDQTLPTDATISISAVTTNNASTTKHGWCPQLSNNAAEFLNGQGAFAVPFAGGATLIDTINCASGATAGKTAISTSYDYLFLIINGVTSANNDMALRMEISSDNSTYGSPVQITSASTGSRTAIVSGKVEIYNTGATANKYILPRTYNANSGTPEYTTFGLESVKTGATTALRFSFASGDFAGGTIAIYGVA